MMTEQEIREELQKVINDKMPGAIIETFHVKVSQTFGGEPTISTEYSEI